MDENKPIRIDLRPHDNTTTATEKLDGVLIYLEENKNEQYSFCGIRMPTKYSKPKSILLTERERDKILKKLEEDKYVDMNMQTPEGASGNLPHFSINFNGEVFIQNGGYSKKKENDDWELLKTKLNFWVLFFAAIGATTYYGLEILKFMCTHF